MDDLQSAYAELMTKLHGLLTKSLQQNLSSLLEFGLSSTTARSQWTSTGFDPYGVLGLEKKATDEEIKKRFRQLARILHPDTAACPGTEFLFSLVNLSYHLIAKERGWF